MVATQREVLGLTRGEADVRAGITAEVSRQGEVLIASRSRALELSRDELATQREMLAASRESMAASAGHGGGFNLPGPVGMAVRAAKDAAEFGAGYMGDAIYEAQKLQTILQSTQNITGANAAQMAKARAAIFNVGDMAAMSPDQTAEMFRDLSRQSVGSMSFKDMLGMLPEMAKTQVVLGAARGFSPHETVDSVMSLTHLFRQYDPAGQKKMFDTVLRMSEVMPTNLTGAVRQMTYFEPTLKNLHVPDQEAAALMVAISRFGMGRGKGGTSLQNLFADALGPLQMTKHAQAGQATLLGPGMLNVLDARGNSRYFNDKSGDPMGFLMALYRFAQKHGSVEAQKVFEGAFKKQGSRVGDLMADPIIIDQLKKIQDVIANQKSLGLNSQATTIFATAQFAEKRAWADFQALATEVGGVALPGVTRAFNDLANALHYAQAWLHQHRSLELEVQRDIVAGVKNVEQYLVNNRGAWRDFGRDLKQIYEDAKTLAPDLKQLADNFGMIFRAVEKLNQVLGGVAHVLNVLGHVKDPVAEKALHKTFGLPYLSKADSKPRGPWELGNGPLKSILDRFKPGWDTNNYETQRQHAVATEQHASITIHVDARGARREDAEHVARAVEKGTRRALAFSQHQLRTSAAPVHVPPHMLYGIGGGTGALT